MASSTTSVTLGNKQKLKELPVVTAVLVEDNLEDDEGVDTPTGKGSPLYPNNVENPEDEDEILDQQKSFAKGYKRTEFGKSKSSEQIALDVKTDHNIITL